MVIQDERQRSINSSSEHLLGYEISYLSNAAIIKPFNRRERHVCTHCGRTGYTVDRCYKLHDFSNGYKPRSIPK